MLVALAWSLFQLWFASPIPFMLGFGVFNDTEARSIHLAFALFLAFAPSRLRARRSSWALGIGVPALLWIAVHLRRQPAEPIWWIPVVAAPHRLRRSARRATGSRLGMGAGHRGRVLRRLYLYVFYRASRTASARRSPPTSSWPRSA
jgi:hypothetical protein